MSLVLSESLNNQQLSVTCLEVTNNCSTARSVSPVSDLSGFDLLNDDDENNLSKSFMFIL